MKNIVSLLLSICALFNLMELQADKVTYSTESDSSLYYYKKGWQEIMDYGQYAKAEKTYRKALSFDPDFLIAQSVLARLTLDFQERLDLYKILEYEKNRIEGDERLILDVYIALTHYTNLRDQNSEQTDAALEKAFKLAENNLRIVVRKYPEEIYLKSEYIEFIHAGNGPQHALDTLEYLVLPHQENNPFILGYKAKLLAELERYEEAIAVGNQLKKLLQGQSIPKPDVVLADIYLMKGDLSKAKKYATKAVQLDSRNLDASRLLKKINELSADSHVSCLYFPI